MIPATPRAACRWSWASDAIPFISARGCLGDPQWLRPYLAGRQVMIVTNEVVAPRYLERCRRGLPADAEVHELVLPDGEATKTLASVSRIWDALLEAGFNRRCTLIALGGG